ncbi:hypothetical protein ACFE04_011267 [Oxalis oulophora]
MGKIRGASIPSCATKGTILLATTLRSSERVMDGLYTKIWRRSMLSFLLDELLCKERQEKEPCIVFSLHWSLRLGLTLHLLHRWCQDEKSLLVLENELNPEIAMLSLKPMEMKVLQCSFLSGIK